MTEPFAWFRYQQGSRVYYDTKKWDDCQPLYTQSASEYERGFIDGMQKQMQSSVDKAVNAMKQTQEPVAWIHNFIDGGISIGKRPADLERHPDRWTALYKDPKPCPTCEALARTVMLDQTSHDTAPPRRTWVDLTDEQMLECNMDGDFVVDREIAKLNVQAKLKEKNT